MARVLIVGGGVIGTMHALEAIRRGHEVVQIERNLEPRKASVRNFGLIWISGRAPGAELELARLARERWEEISDDVPGIGFRPDGSMTLVDSAEGEKVLDEVCSSHDADTRGVRLLTRVEAAKVNPALAGDFRAAMYCEHDAVVEPRKVLPALRAYLASSGRYSFHAGRTVLGLDGASVSAHTGERFEGDVVLLCTGADYTTLEPEHFASAPLKRCRLQMCETAPYERRVTTSVADADSLRYYPAFRTASAPALPAALDLVSRWGMQLLLAQRDDGSLTIGDTHAYDEPFSFWVESAPYDHLLAKASTLLGGALPPVTRWWSGVYSARTNEDDIWYHGEISPVAFTVTGLAGRGMTLSPAVAISTLDRIGL